jgi:WhiB family transcriptional regulator, redox-sensing transcriptional regulator
MTVPMNWRRDAACRDVDPELFFPISTTGAALRQVYEAKRICRGCPAQFQCLAWALEHEVTDGVWGGTTEAERRTLRSLPDERRSMGQPRSSAAPELSLVLTELELWLPRMPRRTSAATAYDR